MPFIAMAMSKPYDRIFGQSSYGASSTLLQPREFAVWQMRSISHDQDVPLRHQYVSDCLIPIFSMITITHGVHGFSRLSAP
jgi:hypothetical protein